MTKISKYRQRLLRERANAGCTMLEKVLDGWRKAYHPGGRMSYEIWESMLREADKMASEWDREYKEAIGLLPPKDST